MNTTIDIFCHWAPPDYGAVALKLAGRPLRMLERALADNWTAAIRVVTYDGALNAMRLSAWKKM